MYKRQAKGAPEAIADLCHFDVERTDELTHQVAAATAGGLRVLAGARAPFGPADVLATGPHGFGFA